MNVGDIQKNDIVTVTLKGVATRNHFSTDIWLDFGQTSILLTGAEIVNIDIEKPAPVWTDGDIAQSTLGSGLVWQRRDGRWHAASSSNHTLEDATIDMGIRDGTAKVLFQKVTS